MFSPIHLPASLGTALLKLINYAIQIRIAGAKASGDPVSTALCDSLAIGEHLKLTGLAGRNHGFNAEPLFNQGHETRDLGFVILSRRAGTYLNFHSVLQVVGSDGSFPANVISLDQWQVLIFNFGNYPILAISTIFSAPTRHFPTVVANKALLQFDAWVALA